MTLQSRSLNRRRFLSGAALAGYAAFSGFTAFTLPSRAEPRAIKQFELRPGPAKKQIAGADWPATDVWAYNGDVPGPLLRAIQGERVRINVTNDLAEPTTVHWHGLRVPNGYDGVPLLTQAPIQPGESFIYEFDLPDAGTYWYHPHLRTTEQMGRGLYGLFIVDEPEPPQVDRDIAWVMDDWRLTQEAQISDDFDNGHDITHGGRIGNSVTLNGKILSHFEVRSGERIRLRLLNSANARIFQLAFNGLTPQIIAIDGHPVEPHQMPEKGVPLGSGQRLDLMIDVGADPGAELSVIDEAYPRFRYEFVTLAVSKEAPLRESPLDAPMALADNPLTEPDMANAETHEIIIQGGAMGSMAAASFEGKEYPIRQLWQEFGKVWALNGVAFAGYQTPPIFTFKKGSSHIVRMKNDTAFPHPMHLHGMAFRILSRNGKPEPHRPWADTVMLQPEEVVEFALNADNPGDWLFHCHILEHHKGGMGSIIRVET